MKYGLISGASGTENTALQWYANSQSQWNVTFEPGVWHNVAYEIDFSGGSVTFWHSTGSDALTKTAGPVSVSASSNGADWHLGVLRLEGNTDATAEDWYFSGVYIESGDLTTEIGSGSSSSSSSASSGSSSASASPAAAAAVSSSASSAAPASTVAAQETTSSAAAVASTTSSSAAAVATPTTLQTLVSSAAASSSSSAAAQPTGQTGSVPATGSNGGDDSSDSSSSSTSGNGLSADEQEEVNQGIYSWYQSLKAWWSANQ